MKISLILFALVYLSSCTPKEESYNKSNDDSINIVTDTTSISDTTELVKTDDWYIDSFVNEFGEQGNNSYIHSSTTGTFSNSATSDEFLYAKLLISKKVAGLFLHEYKISNTPQRFIGTGKIRMKNEDGKELTIFSYDQWNHDGGLSITGNNYKKLIDFLLQSEGEVKVVVYDEYSSTYIFKITLLSYKEKYKEFKTSMTK